MPTGKMVKATKVSRNGIPSEIEVGTVLKGRIKNKGSLNVGDALQLDSGWNTTAIKNAVRTQDGDYIIKTRTSTYLLQEMK